jgi:hypothetical protein
VSQRRQSSRTEPATPGRSVPSPNSAASYLFWSTADGMVSLELTHAVRSPLPGCHRRPLHDRDRLIVVGEHAVVDRLADRCPTAASVIDDCPSAVHAARLSAIGSGRGSAPTCHSALSSSRTPRAVVDAMRNSLERSAGTFQSIHRSIPGGGGIVLRFVPSGRGWCWILFSVCARRPAGWAVPARGNQMRLPAGWCVRAGGGTRGAAAVPGRRRRPAARARWSPSPRVRTAGAV